MEKPIIFSTEMVRAILAGRKTTTRRVIKPQPVAGVRKSPFVKSGLEDGHGREIKPRYYPGDVLWVRETWAPCATIDSWLDDVNLYIYKADFQDKEVSWKWKPSIHMPREAARLFLRVISVRAERLQDITEEDALSEGMTQSLRSVMGYATSESEEEFNLTQVVSTFGLLWDSLNAKRGYGWDTNPWVWIVKFERVENYEGLGKDCTA